MNPNGRVLAIASPDPLASWAIEYVGLSHLVTTTSLDPLHTLPLPPRHPQDLAELKPGETREWRIVLAPCPTNTMSRLRWLRFAMRRCFSSNARPWRPRKPPRSPHCIQGRPNFRAPLQTGNLSPWTPVDRTRGFSKRRIIPAFTHSRRRPMEEVAKRRSSSASHGRGISSKLVVKRCAFLKRQALTAKCGLGFSRCTWPSHSLPDAELHARAESQFAPFLEVTLNRTTAKLKGTKAQTWPERPQNNSWMIGLLTDRYQVTKNPDDLDLAARFADNFIRDFQQADGSFKGYSALTQGNWFLLDLAACEQPLIDQNPKWSGSRERLLAAARRSAEDMVAKKDNVQTEGQRVFEDTMIGAAVTLLSLSALNEPDPLNRQRYVDAAKLMYAKHACLRQEIVPDARVRGGSLRFWESQYDVLMKPNMMNSPHGWTSRNSPGLLFLYLLTGEERYLADFMDTVGSCIQMIETETGTLRWAFIPDPFIKADVFEPDPEKPGQGRYVSKTLGEAYIIYR